MLSLGASQIISPKHPQLQKEVKDQETRVWGGTGATSTSLAKVLMAAVEFLSSLVFHI